jgi:hypothetical protein
VFFILHFCLSYYRNCYRKGYRIDYWHLTLFQTLMVTSLMLPFNRSPLNIIALGPVLLKRSLPFVDEAFLISALGYGSIIIGGNLWRIQLNLGLRKKYSDLLNQPVRAAVLLLRSPRLLFVVGVFAFLIMAAIISIYFFINGFGVNVGSLLIVRPELRPFAQFGAFVGVTVGSLALGRYEVRRERSMLLLAMVLGGALSFYGSRFFLLALVQLPILIWMIRLRTRLNLIFLIALFPCALLLSILLDAMRHGSSVMHALLSAGMLIAFGNSYSDTRDFAVVLSFWDHTFFLGKTYLAGILAFIPRFLSSFRDHWSLGVVTAAMAGFKPTEHAGLRIGNSGEAYLNFGIAAVVLVGLLVGSMAKLIDMRIKESIVRDPGDVRVYAYAFLGVIVSALVNSANFSALYTALMVMLLSAALMLLSRFIKLPLG